MSVTPIANQLDELIQRFQSTIVVRDEEYNSIIARILNAFNSMKIICDQLFQLTCLKERGDCASEVKPVARIYVTEIMTCVTALCVWHEETLDQKEWKVLSRTMCDLMYVLHTFFSCPSDSEVEIPTEDSFYGIYVDGDKEEHEQMQEAYVERMTENRCVTYVGGVNVCTVKQSLLHWSS